MLLYALTQHERLAASFGALAGLEPARWSASRFSNGELHVTLGTAPVGASCLVLGSVAPPDADALTTLLLAHTLHKEGGRRVIALLPYLGYARHDRAEPGKSRATAWMGALLHASAVDEVVSVDVHSRRAAELFPIPLRSLSPAALFAEALRTAGLDDPTVVAPDEGAIERAEALRQAAGISRPIAHLVKTRRSAGVVESRLHGAVSRQAVLADDILDTGGTLVAACEALRGAGVEAAIVTATHGLFTGHGWERLWALGVTRIYCTDTTPLPLAAPTDRVAVLSVAPLLAQHLMETP